ncbi:MAG: putative transcriptional regulator [Planctomycetota bacterium]|jgi:putative transcriptional regulator
MVDSLIGKVLVAGPSLQDPNFQRTVIVICEHNDEGALGIVYNRPSPITVSEALPPLANSMLAGSRLFMGGPVQTEQIFVIHDDEEAGGDEISPGLFYGGEPQLLDHLIERLRAGDNIGMRLFAGYSGWGAGQLEFEMSHGAWIVAPSDKGQILGSEGQNKWRQALLDLGGRYAILADAPIDPGLN